MRRPVQSARLPGALLATALTLGLGLLAPVEAPAGPADPAAAAPFNAEAVKAAYLINFIRFTAWPEGDPAPEAPFAIGVSGNRALEDELIRLADRQLVRERRLRVVRIKGVHDLDGLHVAYFAATAPLAPDSLGAREALPFLLRRPVLTVSEAPDFTAIGGIIGLYRESGALRFEISPDAAQRARLVLSSRLLALARIRRDAPPEPPPPR